VTLTRVERRIAAAQKRAETALELARRGREAIEILIQDMHLKLEVVRSGCVDFDLGEALMKTELSLLHLLRHLEEFERDVLQPAEELHRSVCPSDIRTRPPHFGRSTHSQPEKQLARSMLSQEA
jgi:hypothetical protein